MSQGSAATAMQAGRCGPPRHREMTVLEKCRESPDEDVYRLVGSVTHESATLLRGELEELAITPIQRLVLDLSLLDFIDTGGLGVLVGVRRKFQDVGKEFVIVNPSEKVLIVLRMTRLAALFGVDPA